MPDGDAELARAFRSSKPMKHEILLAGLSVVTFLLSFLELTPYSPTSLLSLGAGLLIGAVISYTMRLSRR